MSNIETRLKKLREKLKENNIDAAFITKRESYIYLSGFTGTAAHLIITQEEATLVTDFRYTQQATAQAPLFNVVQYSGSLIAALTEILKTKHIGTLGFEDYHLTYEKYDEYKQKFDIKELVPLKDIIEKLRICKDAGEIETIKKAVKIADDAFTYILGVIKPGMKEVEVAAELEYYMRKIGATRASFETIVASGKRASLPHGVASEKVIEAGDVITLDYGALYKDYCSDMTRTIFLGEPSEEMKKIYNIVLEAQLKAIEGAKAGLLGKEIDRIARDIINGREYEKNFGHGLGHGVGLEIHEAPRLSTAGEIAMENGMVVTVEPGIYIPEFGGVRIEDMLVINDDKPIVLTASTKQMVIL